MKNPLYKPKKMCYNVERTFFSAFGARLQRTRWQLFTHRLLGIWLIKFKKGEENG